MSKLIDLTGQKFGEWTVISKSNYKKKDCGNTFWTCKCSCGTTKDIRGTDLRNGKTKQCRQHLKNISNKKKIPKFGNKGSAIKDETGNKYFKLTVKSFAYSKNGKAYWNCICDCGNEKIVSGSALRNGEIKSCGCLKSYYEEVISNFLKNKNINFKREFIFKDLKDKNYLRFDFCILDKDNIPVALIEYNGIQHYSNSEKFNHFGVLQIHDQMKKEYCKNNNIPLYILNKDNFSLSYLESIIKET